MAITRRKFILEFRTEAAHRVIDTGRSVRAVASELSIEESSFGFLPSFAQFGEQLSTLVEAFEWSHPL